MNKKNRGIEETLGTKYTETVTSHLNLKTLWLYMDRFLGFSPHIIAFREDENRKHTFIPTHRVKWWSVFSQSEQRVEMKIYWQFPTTGWMWKHFEQGWMSRGDATGYSEEVNGRNTTPPPSTEKSHNKLNREANKRSPPVLFIPFEFSPHLFHLSIWKQRCTPVNSITQVPVASFVRACVCVCWGQTNKCIWQVTVVLDEG